MTPVEKLPELDAVILAGGAAARMGGADKPALEVGGQAMLVTVARAAVAAGARRLVVVGPERTGALGRALANLPGVLTVREEPAGRGPLPALRRGLAEASADWVALLAADLPFLSGAWLSALLGQARFADAAGAVLADAGGRPQWLAGCWRRVALLAALGSYHGDSLGGLLGPLSPAMLGPGMPAFAAVAGQGTGVTRPPWHDCDDPAQLAEARAVADRDGASQDGEA